MNRKMGKFSLKFDNSRHGTGHGYKLLTRSQAFRDYKRLNMRANLIKSSLREIEKNITNRFTMEVNRQTVSSPRFMIDIIHLPDFHDISTTYNY